MADVLTYEPETEVTSVDNLSEEEQDSLQVGETMQEAQDNLLAGKYKNAEELEKAHIELQKKLGEKSGEKETTDTPPETEAKEEKTEDESPPPQQTNVLEELWEQASSGQKFTDETLGKLRNTNPAELAQTYLRFRKENSPRDLTDQDVTTLKSLAGGEAQYDSMLEWANKSLNKQEIDMFDKVMEKGDPLAAFFAVRSLAYRYHDATGYEGKMVTGTAPKQNADQFRSQQEVIKAMSDPRYEDDPAYRNDIMKKLERSEINF